MVVKETKKVIKRVRNKKRLLKNIYKEDVMPNWISHGGNWKSVQPEVSKPKHSEEKKASAPLPEHIEDKPKVAKKATKKKESSK